ncbi:MAG: hypothetical protein ACHQF0_00890 [Chitinophagales bacterium]
MKKPFFALMLLFIGTSLVNAQNKDDKWLLTTGPVLSLPNKYLHDFHSFGIGADFAAIHPINNGWSAGGRANYTYFFGKQSSNTSGNTISSHYDATHLFNILGDVNYLFENNLIVGVDLGLGVSLTHTNADASFARIIYLAYQVNLKSPVMFALYFDQTDFQKNFGFRAGFRI